MIPILSHFCLENNSLESVSGTLLSLSDSIDYHTKTKLVKIIENLPVLASDRRNLNDAVFTDAFSLQIFGEISARFEENVLEIDQSEAFEVFSKFTDEILTDRSSREIFELSFESFFSSGLVSADSVGKMTRKVVWQTAVFRTADRSNQYFWRLGRWLYS